MWTFFFFLTDMSFTWKIHLAVGLGAWEVSILLHTTLTWWPCTRTLVAKTALKLKGEEGSEVSLFFSPQSKHWINQKLVHHFTSLKFCCFSLDYSAGALVQPVLPSWPCPRAELVFSDWHLGTLCLTLILEHCRYCVPMFSLFETQNMRHQREKGEQTRSRGKRWRRGSEVF